MPSRHSYERLSHLAPLSEIIELEPEEEPWCAGYAPSQGRRCHARTNARGRRSAIALLNEGTKDILAGRSIDELLEDLAPHVLCTRWHQSQASTLASRWKRQVRTYLDSQPTSRSFARPVRPSTRHLSRETFEASTEDRALRLRQRLRALEEELRQLEAAENNLPSTPSPRARRRGTDSSAVIPSSTRHTSSRNTSPESVVDRPVERRITESTNQLAVTVQVAVTVPRPTQVQVVSPTQEAPVSSPEPATPPAVDTASSSNEESSSDEDQQRRVEHSHAHRRDIDGDCGICLCDLRTSEQDAEADGEDTEDTGDDDSDEDESDSDEDDDSDDDDSDDNDSDDENSDGDSSDDDNPDDDNSDDGDLDDDDDDDQGGDDSNQQIKVEAESFRPNKALVWCKAVCGVNFHEKCIEQWLRTANAPTCPTCRSDWKH
ncbi:uncharacterized protein N7500_009296 [Penicillium coprophilum]|uniref:uncharacterized protein n=1 Tax=Penicillium coprophilum TaxID=36646 RepID=UPI00239A4D88|nr:uncharacterized protein N7500_009296 [Penicillium coprophilum]KAJ5153857.1 hypothetical protein N7500_009296 [Penicillium coprophilum]